jgi:phosphatidylglycerol:prolipoprotein diacylglycerol transferase
MLNLFRALFAPPRDLILLVAAAWVGLALADKRAKQSPVGEKAMDTLVGVAVAAFVAGGRVLYAAEHLSAFARSPVSLLSPNAWLFDMWGGLAAAVVAGAAVIQRKRLPAWHTLDLLTPLLAAIAVGLSLSHLASGAAFGTATNVPWAIYLWGARRQPTQVYELFAGLAILAVVWFYERRAAPPGKTFLLWIALAAASRLLIEGFRGDSTLVLGGLRLAQIIAWVVLASALGALEALNQRQSIMPEPAREGQTPEPAPAPRADKRKRAAPGRNSAQ